MSEPPRDNLTRSYVFDLERDDSGDGLTLTGYAAVFDQPTVIDSWEGRFEETISRGAFRKTLRERTPVVMFDHGQHPMIGSIPLGSVRSVEERAGGLWTDVRLHDNWMIQPIRDAVQSGAIPGMSIRMSVVKDSWKQPARDSGELPKRTIQEVSLIEFGPVVFPAYTGTSVGVRAQEWAQQLMDPEARIELARALLLGTPMEPPAVPEPLEHSEPEPVARSAEPGDPDPEPGTAPSQSPYPLERVIRWSERRPFTKDSHA